MFHCLCDAEANGQRGSVRQTAAAGTHSGTDERDYQPHGSALRRVTHILAQSARRDGAEEDEAHGLCGGHI